MTRAISPHTRRSARLSYAAGFLVIIVTLEVLVRYERYARVLEVLSLALLAYVATVFSVPVDWRQALAGLVPTLRPGHHYATALVAIAGTTLSPYLLFWQAGQEAEITQRDSTKAPLIARPAQAPCELRRIRFDTYVWCSCWCAQPVLVSCCCRSAPCARST
jgi:Mn2+/Fe2+ NRAMP family transporter